MIKVEEPKFHQIYCFSAIESKKLDGGALAPAGIGPMHFSALCPRYAGLFSLAIICQIQPKV